MDVNLFECSLFHSLKHKVTVEKDTVNIKQAVCCSEVGQIDASVKRRLYPPNGLKSSSELCANNASSVILTGLRFSCVCVVQRLMLAIF